MQTPAPFDYERATTVDGAIAALAEHGPEARLIAGGHSLLPMMKLRLANPEYLIDINDLEELSYIQERMTDIRIGALTRHCELLESELLAARAPVFRDAEEVIADPVERNRGTQSSRKCLEDRLDHVIGVGARLDRDMQCELGVGCDGAQGYLMGRPVAAADLDLGSVMLHHRPRAPRKAKAARLIRSAAS